MICPARLTGVDAREVRPALEERHVSPTDGPRSAQLLSPVQPRSAQEGSVSRSVGPSVRPCQAVPVCASERDTTNDTHVGFFGRVIVVAAVVVVVVVGVGVGSVGPVVAVG